MKILLTTLSLIIFAAAAHSAETVGEKIEAKTNDVERSIKSTAHRADEEMCEKTDKNCFAKKANNRTKEAKDYAKDKTAEVVNVMDNDKADKKDKAEEKKEKKMKKKKEKMKEAEQDKMQN